MELRKLFVWCSLALFLSLFGAAAYWHEVRLPDPVSLPISESPRLGPETAKIRFVLFEDPLCRSCQAFQRNTFPDLQHQYIDPGKANYTMVLLALKEDSWMPANAALAVFAIAPSRGFSFASALFSRSPKAGWTKDSLLSLAETVGGISLPELQTAIEQTLYYPQLQKNYEIAKTVMRGNVLTPTLFINGFPAPTQSIEAIERFIEFLEKDIR